ncbi:MAG TPA: type II toxin-antitoxin system VapC family toxin [Aquificaceae bacterium]|nr:type II toxin-antitoxin system VapC family toxin [Aquificaceae bacterium]
MQYEGILDTNLFLRYLHDGTEEEKEKFRKLIKEATHKGAVFYVPSIVIVEMVYVLEKVYGLPKSEVREIVESIFSLPVEVENFEVILKALALYEEKNLKFGDALVLAYAQVRRIKPIYTFDSDFEKFSKAKVL